jgi:GntR family transcriptional regulator, arabinose operon transcriptional repressor
MTTATTLYIDLANSLRADISSGRVRPGQLFASEHDLARSRKLSRVTVRKASDVLIGEGLLERRPGKGLFVRTAQTGRASTIQVVCGNLEWIPSLQATRAIKEVARTHNFQIQIYDAHGSMAEDLDAIRRLPETEARGAIIFALHSVEFAEAIYSLKVSGFPCVLIDQRLADLDVSTVMADNHAGGYLAGQALTRKGHKRIAFIGDLDADTVQDRLAGLRDAIGDAGLPFNRSLVQDVSTSDRFGSWAERVDQQLQPLFASPDAPTAIFASCDAIARDVYAALGRMGLMVPRDVSVVGFDDDPLASQLAPALTTVSQPFQDMGRAAFELLHQRILDPASPVEHRRVPVQLVERGSIATASRSARSST